MLPAPVGSYYRPVHITTKLHLPRATSSIRPFSMQNIDSIMAQRFALIIEHLRGGRNMHTT